MGWSSFRNKVTGALPSVASVLTPGMNLIPSLTTPMLGGGGGLAGMLGGMGMGAGMAGGAGGMGSFGSFPGFGDNTGAGGQQDLASLLAMYGKNNAGANADGGSAYLGGSGLT